MADDETWIAEQIRYYRARAPEYDEGYTRQGRYDLGVEVNRTWASELAQAQDALLASRPEGQHPRDRCRHGLLDASSGGSGRIRHRAAR